MGNAFGKSYKLCSKIQISRLFSNGKQVKSTDLNLIFLKDEFNIEKSFQVMISVSKKKYKKAVQRNLIKRVCREAIRENKLILESYLIGNGKKVLFIVNYKGPISPKQEELKPQIKSLFEKLIKNV